MSSSSPSTSRNRARVTLDNDILDYTPSWLIEDETTVPESRPHELLCERVRQLLVGWTRRGRRDAQVGRNIALRWDESHPKVGVDPDVYVVEPPPPEGDQITSLRTWETGNAPPLLAIEIVSPSRPEKDYGQSPQKYASSGTNELWIFDPKMAGPASHGGPFRLQVWRRDEHGRFARVYAGEGPARSEAINAWVFVTNEGRGISIADDAEGTRFWMTPEETERSRAEAERGRAEAERSRAEAERERAEAERARAERERAEKERAQKRIAELEALLAGKS